MNALPPFFSETFCCKLVLSIEQSNTPADLAFAWVDFPGPQLILNPLRVLVQVA
jgi:hypothetical protein